MLKNRFSSRERNVFRVDELESSLANDSEFFPKGNFARDGSVAEGYSRKVEVLHEPVDSRLI
jgi:hypothetical protein